jgi:hypothetical protein
LKVAPHRLHMQCVGVAAPGREGPNDELRISATNRQPLDCLWLAR